MTNTPFTDSSDVLGIVCSATGVITAEPLFYVLGSLCFILSFGIRLGNEQRIEKYLAGIRSKVRR